MRRQMANRSVRRATVFLTGAASWAVSALCSPSVAAIVIQGTGGSDTIDVSGSSTPHEIYGKGGSDRIFGSQADDVLLGESGSDEINGNSGRDRLDGGSGNDTLRGGDSDDDFLFQGNRNGSDVIDGGPGSDRILGSALDDVIGVRAISSIELIDGGGGFDVVQLQSASGLTLNLSGSILIGVELIAGGSSSDTIIASVGDDVIRGGNGNDRIEGGAGRDFAIYTGERSGYVLSSVGGATAVRALTTKEGTDTLTGIEVIRFADGDLENGVFYPRYPDNRPPVAAGDSATVAEDLTVEIDVLANDYDPDGDTLAIRSVGAPWQGRATVSANGSITYSPNANFTGRDTFSYVVEDGKFGRTTAVVVVDVLPVPDAPIAQDDEVFTLAGTAVQFMPLLNDRDVDGDILRIESVAQPLNGTISNLGGGRLTYSPRAGFVGSETLGYVVSDGTGRTAMATIRIEVRPQTGDAFARLLADAPEGSWLKVNKNRFSDVWTPMSQRSSALGYVSPAKIIHAWSSMAWDRNRRQLILWGGGHANYSGNEVYRFDAYAGLWERASLPSQAVAPLGDSQYFAIDGPMNAPIAAHTYDNQEFMPNIDRFITFGGGKFNCCAKFVLADGKTPTGPYLWDPSRAGADMVGGTTGSQVNPAQYPEVIGAAMWQNRDALVNNGIGAPRPVNFVSGTSAYAENGGRDSVFVTEAPSEGGKLFRYTINSVDEPNLDEWQLVGVQGRSSYSNQGAGAYDPMRGIYARTANSSAGPVLVVWNTSTPGPANGSVNVQLKDAEGKFSLSVQHGMDYDEVRRVFVLWDGGPEVWQVLPPETFGANGWTVVPAPVSAATLVPDRSSGAYTSPSGTVTPSRGILGKWKYARTYDLFFGIEDPVNGDVWVYKPTSWQPLIKP